MRAVVILLALTITSCGVLKKKKKGFVEPPTLQQNFETLDSLHNVGFNVTDTRIVLGETILYLNKGDINLAFSERYGILN